MSIDQNETITLSAEDARNIWHVLSVCRDRLINEEATSTTMVKWTQMACVGTHALAKALWPTVNPFED